MTVKIIIIIITAGKKYAALDGSIFSVFFFYFEHTASIAFLGVVPNNYAM